MSISLTHIFSDLISKYSDDEEVKTEYWSEIEKSYSQKNRKYHNFTHIQNIILELKNVKEKLQIDIWFFDLTFQQKLLIIP